MTSGADLFVVCKQCGSEVSPYITECPYCGHRLRRRAPKLPRVHASSGPSGARGRLSTLLHRSPVRRPRRARTAAPRSYASRWATPRPYVTIALVALSCGAWVAWHAEPSLYLHMAIVGPLNGDWWKLLTYEFAYIKGLYAFVAIAAIALFGWLLERRHGPAGVLALALGGGATGALVAEAVYAFPWVGGGNCAALALLGAWVAPELGAERAGEFHEADLLGAGAIAALLLALPFALVPAEASWLAGVTGGAFGLLIGLGLQRSAFVEP